MVGSRGHHGYPQPVDGYETIVYATCCQRCGIHGPQVAPFRFKRSTLAAHSSFLQLNWVFDAFFVRKEVALGMTEAGITGVSYGPALDHQTGEELADRVQLLMETIACAETSHLPVVTCRANNEESKWSFHAGEKRYSPETPYCGRMKNHAPSSLAIHPDALKKAPDLFQTEEWFGSGGEAHRLTIGSERFVRLVRELSWRGLRFERVLQEGFSERHFHMGGP
jgi:hypothetical protein